jgi:predicted nucleotidyltransferase
MNEDKNSLLQIINILNQNGVDFIIAGGVAVVLHGVERLTMDLDTAVRLDKDNLEKFIKSMGELGMVPRLPISADSLLDEEKMRIMCEEKNALVFTFIDPNTPIKQVDFFLAENLSYESLKNDYEEMDLDGQKIKVLSKSKLVELKLNVDPMRDKDLSDIKELQKRILNE